MNDTGRSKYDTLSGKRLSHWEAKRREERRKKVIETIKAMPDRKHADPLLADAALRLQLLGYEALADEVGYIGLTGDPITEKYQVSDRDRILTVAKFTGWELTEVPREPFDGRPMALH